MSINSSVYSLVSRFDNSTIPLPQPLIERPGNSSTVSLASLAADSVGRVRPAGKFLNLEGERFLIKGVTYGTFCPDAEGQQFPPTEQATKDFATMAEYGINTVRVYTVPSRKLLDEAARHGLRVMVGIPWAQHIAFLDDRALGATIRRDVAATVRLLSDHPGVLLF